MTGAGREGDDDPAAADGSAPDGRQGDGASRPPADAAGAESGAGSEAAGGEGAGSEAAGRAARDQGGEPIRSGLRNPRAAVRALGAGTLLLEALALLLAIVPLRVLGAPPAAVVSVVTLAVAAVVLAAFLRYDVTWYIVGGLNIAVTLSGYFQWAIGVLGVVFALVWWYVLYVRRTILGR
ncbi:MAG: DUF4233 domain-containing protein [Micromonosporaceae bacterium]